MSDTGETAVNKVAIKFLLSNGLTGSLIGSGGAAIKELALVTGAKIHVSSTDEVYPGTNDRVVLIAGSEGVVSLAQSLIWELIAQNNRTIEAGERSETWSPKVAVSSPSFEQHDESFVGAKITIPAAVGGLVLGRGGATIRHLASESQAKISMTSKEEAIFTQERVLNISGPKSSCVKCLSMVLSKLAEDTELNQFVNRGTNYVTNISTYDYTRGAGAVSNTGKFSGSGGTGRGGGGAGRGYGRENILGQVIEDVSSSTTISMSVPEGLVGNILGKNGTSIREITCLSGARITVSSRGEYIEGTNNRLVTISGTPQCAQTAHHLIQQRLHQSPRSFSVSSASSASTATGSGSFTSQPSGGSFTSGGGSFTSGGGSFTSSAGGSFTSPARHFDSPDTSGKEN